LLYAYDLTIPAQTPVSAPSSRIVPVTYGVLRQVAIAFPALEDGQVGVAIFSQAKQIAPANLGGSICLADEFFSWADEIPLTVPPFELELSGWSTVADATVTIPFFLVIAPPQRERGGALLERLLSSPPSAA
jgi:hypothetical protein